MNILDIQDKLKNLSQDQLTQEMQSPTGSVPQFLVLSEINRRQSMRQSMQQQNAGSQTVAQELLNSAGVPAEGASDMAQSMAPKSSIAQNTGIGSLPQEAPPPETGGIASLAPQEQQPAGMAEGGVVKLERGTDAERRAELEAYRNRVGNTAGWVADKWDANAFGIPSAGTQGLLGLIDTGLASATGLIPGADDVTMYLQDKADEDFAGAGEAWNNGVFPNLYTPPPGMDTGTPLAAAELPPGYTEPPAAPVDQDLPGVGGVGGSGGSGSAGGGKLSSYEQMLMDAMNNADKKAKQDKWLALAQAGMSLMSSTQPNLAGALGEAGNAGIAALQSSRDTAEQNKLKLAQELYGLQESKAAAARASAPKPMSSENIINKISKLNTIIESIGSVDPLTGGTISDQDKVAISELSAQRDALIGMLNQGSTGSADLSDIAQAAAAQ